LYAADLSVSLAGYNTCMNLLVSKVPSLVYPYSRQQEQPMRADRINNLLPMKIMSEVDIQPDRLSKLIDQILQKSPPVESIPLNLDGAAHAARFLNGLRNK
jgi:predicted glycosyltransferase